MNNLDLLKLFTLKLVAGIWVFSIENQIFLKRLQFLPKQKLKVISDNPAYETYFLDLDETFRLLARYIATLSIKI